ncbi:unnamed protein product [Laminaria digitata]
MSEPTSLNRYLQATTSAPLSPTAWTRLLHDGGEKKLASSSANGDSNGARALPVVAGEAGKDSPHLAEASGRGRVDACAIDLCGALSRTRLDPRSPGVRELRVELSFPDLLDDRPTDLLAEARQRLSESTDPAKSRGDGSGGRGGKSSAKDRAGMPGLSRRPGSLPSEPFAPPRRHTGDHNQRTGVTAHAAAALELGSVGWEQTEAGWNDPSVPKWALASAPLATAEGGPGSGAFEVCYREHFGGGATGLEEEVPPTAEADVVDRALSVLQGVPSETFWYDNNKACMRVSGCGEDEKARLGVEKVALAPRVVGLSPGALLSLLGEFAEAGTWFRRVEEFAIRLLDRSAATGQVAQAFGIELRRQLTVLQSAILGVTAEISGLGCNASKGAFIDSTMHERRDEAGYELPPPSAKCCSLMGVLVRTAALRRAAEALAEVCGLCSKELDAVAGVRTVMEAFPRGASLLTYLYNAGEVRAALKPGGAKESTGMGGVMGDKDSVLALLSCAAAPYLVMLGRWLWSGELLVEDDPHEEFPLRCREALTGGAGGSSEDSRKEKEPWMEDGGGSFMTLAFRENESAGVPCFLDGGVLAAAARAGKLLRLLKVSFGVGAISGARSPGPRYGVGDEEGDGRQNEERTAAVGRKVGVWKHPSLKASSVAALTGRGILSFLDPPTSEAEAFAAAALSERYRLLGEEADARAARARWKRQRSERAVAARASLNMLYAKEANAWKVMAAKAAGERGETESRGVDAAISTVAVRDGVGEVGRESDNAGEVVEEDKGTGHRDTEGGVEIEAEEVEDAVVQGGLTAQGRSSGHDGAVTAKEQAAPTTVERDSRQGDRDLNTAKFSPVTIVQEPGGKSTGVAAALGKRAGETLPDGATLPDDPPLKFSQVKIVQEPGGKSDGVSRALGADADPGDDTLVASAHGTGEGTQELRDNASSVSRVSSSASLHRAAGAVDGAVHRLGDVIVGETDGRDNRESCPRENQASDSDFASVLHAVETMGGGEGGVGSQSGESLQDGQIDWRQSSNLDAAFAASASAAGLDSLPLAPEMFRYEVDPTCGGILGGSFAGAEDGGLRCPVPSALGTYEELYSPAALSFVSPVVEVPWPVGVLLPTGVLRTYSNIHRYLFRHQLVLHRLRRLRVAFRELDAAINAWGGGRRRGGRGAGSDDGAGVSWDAGRLHWMHLFRHEMQHMADSLQAFFAEQAETGWPDLRKSLAVTEGTGSFSRTPLSGGGLAVLVAAHSSYISNMHSHMFLGTDRHGVVARARIEEFYEVVSTVGRVTDSLLPEPSQIEDVRSGRGGVSRTRSRDSEEGMVLPDRAFEELAAARGRFDTARQGLCGALLDISAAGGSARARPFLAILGYNGYGGDSIA